MIIKYSDNPFKQAAGIAFYSRHNILLFTTIATLATVQFHYAELLGLTPFDLPVVPISILGSALAIFLGFRNNSAYDRWWEARKIWGGIVNASRTFSTFVISYSSNHFSEHLVSEDALQEWRKELIHRHIAWMYALKMHLRKQNAWDELSKYISHEEIAEIKKYHNKPTQLLHKQSLTLQKGYDQRITEDFRHMELGGMVKELFSLQGKAERIKTTVFPYYYNYFTIVFLWLFIVCLPFALVPEMGWVTIPMSMAISFVFTILEKSGAVTEDPFEGRAADTPISTITRNIEIDLLEMLKSETIPAPLDPIISRFGVTYIE